MIFNENGVESDWKKYEDIDMYELLFHIKNINFSIGTTKIQKKCSPSGGPPTGSRLWFVVKINNRNTVAEGYVLIKVADREPVS